MGKYPTRIALAVLSALVATAGTTTPLQAQVGAIRVVVSKVGFVGAVGGGRGILTFRGKLYPFIISGLSLGATVGISTNQLVGYAYPLRRPGDLGGTYRAAGLGGAVAVGVSRVRLRNENGVILLLQGSKFGVEMSASVGRVNITME